MTTQPTAAEAANQLSLMRHRLEALKQQVQQITLSIDAMSDQMGHVADQFLPVEPTGVGHRPRDRKALKQYYADRTKKAGLDRYS